MSAALAFNELSNWNMAIEGYYIDNGCKWILTYTLKTFEASTKCSIYFIGPNGFSFMWCIKVAKHVEGFRNYIFRFQAAFFMWLGLKNSGNILFFIYLNLFVSDAPFLSCEPVICRVNQWSGFYLKGTSAMKDSKSEPYLGPCIYDRAILRKLLTFHSFEKLYFAKSSMTDVWQCTK